MNIKEIIQRLKTAMDDARGQESHFESWLTQNEGICDAIDALKELDKTEQEPVATVTSEAGNPDVRMSWWHEPALPVGTKLYTTPPQRKPLTDERIADIVIEMNGNEPTALFWRDLAQAIEAAHGIKGDA